MSGPASLGFKESGTEWIGQVPTSWDVKPLKHVADFVNGMAFKPSDWTETGTPIIRIENLNGGDQFNCFPEHANPRYHVAKGDLLFGWSGNRGTSFGPFVWPREGLHYLNQHIFKVNPIRCSPRWLYWCLKAVTNYVEQQAHGMIGMVHVTKGKLGASPVPVPPDDAQEAIADFLDSETAKIDVLIEKQGSFLSRLDEHRRALVTDAMTRGVRADKKMRSVDLEGLDAVPAHWAVKRLRYIAGDITVGVVVTPSKFYAETGVPALRSLNVKEMEISRDDLVFFDEASHRLLSKSALHEGDLVAVRTGKPGTTAVIGPDADGANCIDLIIIRRSPRFVSRFLAHFMNSDFARAQYVKGSEGALQLHFNIETAKDLLVPLPPVEEQAAIVEYLDARLARVDALRLRSVEMMDRLREHRAALIIAAVTGQIALCNTPVVREEAA